MIRYLLAVSLLAGAITPAQDSSPAAAIAARQEMAEERRMMKRDIDDLNQGLVQQQRRINELIKENRALETQISEMDARFKAAQANAVSRKDLEKIVEALKEVDRNRVADNKLIRDKIEEIAKIATRTPSTIIVTQAFTPEIRRHEEPEKIDKPEDDAPPPSPRGYYTYEIQKNDTLVGIINAYNAKLKEQGKAAVTLDQVKKANPKLNPNKMVVGKEVLIPIPPDK